MSGSAMRIDVDVEDFVALEGEDPVLLTNVFHPPSTALTVAPATAAHLSTLASTGGAREERLFRAVLLGRVTAPAGCPATPGRQPVRPPSC